MKINELLESANYAENLAARVYENDPDLQSEDDILNAGFVIAKEELGAKRAQYNFAYDEDFASDYVSAYRWQQRNQVNEISTATLDKYTKAANADYDKAKEQGDSKRMYKRGLNLMKASGKKIDNDVKAMQKARGVAEDNMPPPPQQPSTQDTPQQAKVRAALAKGLEISDKNDADEVSRQTIEKDKGAQGLTPIRREGGWNSRGIRAIDSIEPDGTIVIDNQNYYDLNSLKQLLAWGGMAGAKLITRQQLKQKQGVAEDKEKLSSLDKEIRKELDPQTTELINIARAKYPSAKSDIAAVLKLLQRTKLHSDQEDRQHDSEIADLQQRVDRLEQNK